MRRMNMRDEIRGLGEIRERGEISERGEIRKERGEIRG
jgi:hypothetical protein